VGIDAYISEQLVPHAAARLPAAAQLQIDALRITQQAMPALLQAMEDQRRQGETAATEEARKAAQQAYQQEMTRLAREAATRQLLRALYSPWQLQEHLTWFWFNHFNVHQFKHNIRAMLGDYEEHALRPHVLGRFRDLLGAVVHHPAMLRYLDNDQNGAKRLNENYARELLELHTLGVNGGYSQNDVQELARVLTGHGYTLATEPPKLKADWSALYKRDGNYEFNPARHDFGDKTVLGLVIRGQGAGELDRVLDLLARHPSTARFVSRKLAQYLLADEPPAALVDRMAATFTAGDGRLSEVLGTLLRSAEFANPASAKFKDPMHFVISAVRAAYGDKIILNTSPLQNWLNRLGQGLYNRQTPDGYPATASAWNGSGQMAQRFDIARAIGGGSAGLFKPDEPGSPREQAAFPQLMRPLYYNLVLPTLHPDTRLALDAAGSPQDWNALYLSSPEFMVR
jgi:uncharacterized protein (DUF1800 family)